MEKEYPLASLDPTQRVFVSLVLEWIRELALVYKSVCETGKQKRLPKKRAWLAGSAGSGKSTTLKALGWIFAISGQGQAHAGSAWPSRLSWA